MSSDINKVEEVQTSLIEIRNAETEANKIVESGKRKKETAVLEAKAKAEKLLDKVNTDASELKNKLLKAGREKIQKQEQEVLDNAENDKEKMVKDVKVKSSSLIDRIFMQFIKW
ncbi:hypothetical protein HY570_03835 [Candidatus Micrarchaeota archaeon]|nr:hypothetical protein [Candidatus Micrarchaeota archaeon]